MSASRRLLTTSIAVDKKPIAIHFPKNSINKSLLKSLGYEYHVKLGNRIFYVVNDFLKYYFESPRRLH